jgi:holo-[acyl-carrier protein] synthase
MTSGLGIDIVEVKRIKGLCERFGDRFLKRVFAQNEIAYCFSHKDPYPHLAARFAAKEAFVKASGLVEFSFREISVDKNGDSPVLSLKGVKREDFLISLSHTRDYAVAVVIMKGEKP